MVVRQEGTETRKGEDAYSVAYVLEDLSLYIFNTDTSSSTASLKSASCPQLGVNKANYGLRLGCV